MNYTAISLNNELNVIEVTLSSLSLSLLLFSHLTSPLPCDPPPPLVVGIPQHFEQFVSSLSHHSRRGQRNYCSRDELWRGM
jgi:hypothetical protein